MTSCGSTSSPAPRNSLRRTPALPAMSPTTRSGSGSRFARPSDMMVPADAGWRPLFHVGHDDALTTYPVAFGPPAGTTAYLVDRRQSDTDADVAIEDGSGATTLIGEDARADVLGMNVNPLSHQVE